LVLSDLSFFSVLVLVSEDEPAPPVPEASLLAPFFFLVFLVVLVVVSLLPLPLVSLDFVADESVLLPPVPLVDLDVGSVLPLALFELPVEDVSLPLPVELVVPLLLSVSRLEPLVEPEPVALPDELRSFFDGSLAVCASPGLASINPRINPNFANIFTAFPPIRFYGCPALPPGKAW
jgi:hypothetical protein